VLERAAKCDIVLGKCWRCECGDDHEWRRVVARQRFEDGVLSALFAGANANPASKTIILPMFDHIVMPDTAGIIPACVFPRTRCGTDGQN
jgi:hypothetical protein